MPPAPWAAFHSNCHIPPHFVKQIERREEDEINEENQSEANFSATENNEKSNSNSSDPNLLVTPYSSFNSESSSSSAIAHHYHTIAQSHKEHAAIQWPIISNSLPDLNSLASLEFNPFDYNEDSLLHSCVLMIEDAGLISTFELELPILQSFLVGVRSKYRANPYHNFYHGFAVMQFAYHAIKQTELIDCMPKIDVLALLIACLCHDIDHTGHTNAFEVAAASELALAHNDQAVLENHHASTTFALLREPSMAIFSPHHSKLSGDEIRALRKTVIACILATDMARHFDMCHELDNQEPECAAINWNDESDRQFILNLITHSSDLSGQITPLNIAQQWERRVTEEFTAQSKLEAEFGLPLTPYFQDLHIEKIRFKNHLNYIDFVMTPLWTGLVEMFPPLRPCCENLITNRKFFSDKIHHEENENDNSEEVENENDFNNGAIDEDNEDPESSLFHSTVTFEPRDRDASIINNNNNNNQRSHFYRQSLSLDGSASIVHVYDDSEEVSQYCEEDGNPICIVEEFESREEIQAQRNPELMNEENNLIVDDFLLPGLLPIISPTSPAIRTNLVDGNGSGSASSQSSGSSASSTAPVSPNLPNSMLANSDPQPVSPMTNEANSAMPKKHESIKDRRESRWGDLVHNTPNGNNKDNNNNNQNQSANASQSNSSLSSSSLVNPATSSSFVASSPSSPGTHTKSLSVPNGQSLALLNTSVLTSARPSARQTIAQRRVSVIQTKTPH